MRFSRNLRKWLTACTLGFMLLAQQSVAAYACTTSLQDIAKAAAAMPDCEDSATISALCLKHCEAGSEAAGQADVAGTAIAAPVLHYFVVQTVIAPPAIDVRQHHLAYAPSPPLIVRLQRFLI
ncbi:MAG: hypothetical protein ACO1PN_01000 [Betaproteobacteria bacterium]